MSFECKLCKRTVKDASKLRTHNHFKHPTKIDPVIESGTTTQDYEGEDIVRLEKEIHILQLRARKKELQDTLSGKPQTTQQPQISLLDFQKQINEQSKLNFDIFQQGVRTGENTETNESDSGYEDNPMNTFAMSIGQ